MRPFHSDGGRRERPTSLLAARRPAPRLGIRHVHACAAAELRYGAPVSGRLLRAAAKIGKANEFKDVAALVVDDWRDGAVSAAVSAGINAADALMVLATGDFEMHGRHDNAPAALTGQGFASEAKQLRALIAVKNRAQYSADRCTQKQARDAVARAIRLVESAQNEYEREKGKP